MLPASLKKHESSIKTLFAAMNVHLKIALVSLILTIAPVKDFVQYADLPKPLDQGVLPQSYSEFRYGLENMPELRSLGRSEYQLDPH